MKVLWSLGTSVTLFLAASKYSQGYIHHKRMWNPSKRKLDLENQVLVLRVRPNLLRYLSILYSLSSKNRVPKKWLYTIVLSHSFWNCYIPMLNLDMKYLRNISYLYFKVVYKITGCLSKMVLYFQTYFENAMLTLVSIS